MKPSSSTKFFYGLGSVSYGVVDTGFSYFLLFFYSAVVGLPAHLTGLALMAALFFDALSDPIVGHVSDNLHSKWGRRHPFMYAAIVPIAISFFFLWHPPAALWNPAPGSNESWLLFGYLIMMAAIVRTCVTFFEVPSSALVAEFTQDYDQRTVLLSYRYFFGWVGGLTMSILAYIVFLTPTPDQPQGQLNAAGYTPYAITSALVIAAAILISSLGTHRQIPTFRHPPPKRQFKLSKTLSEIRETLANRSFIALFLAAIIGAIAGGIATTLFLYLMTYFWGLADQQIGVILFSGIVSAVIALTIAPGLARGRNKKRVAIALSVFSACYLPLLVLLRLLGLFVENDSPWFFPILWFHYMTEITVLISIGILVSSMVADVVEDSELRTGRRTEGIFFAARSFAAKMTNGLGVFAGGMIVAAAALPSVASGEAPSEASVRTLAMIYIPALTFTYLCSTAMLLLYRIDREGHSRNLAELAAIAEREQTGV